MATAPAPAPAPRRSQANAYYEPAESQYQEQSQVYQEEEQQTDRATPDTTAFLADDDFIPLSQVSNASRKRKRDAEEAAVNASELEHTMYGDELLDYFVTAGDDPSAANIFPPIPPANFDVNRPIDTHGNNALHWACAMGDVEVTKDLVARGANPATENTLSGETPLMRAVLFTNNFDKGTFPKIVNMLAGTIVERDRHGATVFHHIAETARSRSKWSCARYYCEVLINKMLGMGYNYVQTLLLSVDENDDTAVLCAIRNGCIKVATFLLNHCPEAGDVPNHRGETANEILRILREKRESLEQPVSSPPRADDPFHSDTTGGFGRSRKRSRQSTIKTDRKPLSMAAANMLNKVYPLVEEKSAELANMYDIEMKEKDMAIAEAKSSLSEFENQRHKLRQEHYALMARAEAEGFADADGENKLSNLRREYEDALREVSSLLEQREHSVLQKEVREQDTQTPPQAFRSANNDRPLTDDEMRATLPWVIELSRHQNKRRQLIGDIAKLRGDAGTGEKVGKHRKLVAIATGLKEEELDAMSLELLESLSATKASPIIDDGVGGPRTPPRTVTGLI